MLIDRYPTEDIFARVPKMTQRIDPVLQQLDQLLDDDEVYHQVRNDFGKRHRYTKVAWTPFHAGGSEARVCCCSSTCTDGVIKRPKIGWTRAWCCAGFVACSLNQHPLIPH